MDTLTRHLPRLRWQWMQWQQRLGFWGVLALAVMAAALVVEVSVIHPANSADRERRQILKPASPNNPRRCR